MYTAAQFRRLLRQVPSLELCDVYDFWYDIEEPLKLSDELSDTVFVLEKTLRFLCFLMFSVSPDWFRASAVLTERRWRREGDLGDLLDEIGR